jgi:hypothetical protein
MAMAGGGGAEDARAQKGLVGAKVIRRAINGCQEGARHVKYAQATAVAGAASDR